VLVFACPPLFGEGYAAIRALLSGHPESLASNSLYSSWLSGGTAGTVGMQAWVFLAFLLATLVLKLIATPLTNASGGVGGIFAPSLFIGCLAGTILARVVNVSGVPVLLGINPAPEQNLALVGMAGVLAGVMHAPLTAIFLIAEITGGYGLFIPLIVTSAISFYVIRRFEKYSVYTIRLAQEGQLITHEKDKSALTLMRLAQFVRNDAPVIPPSAALSQLVELISNTLSEVLVVVEDQKFVGLIPIASIRPVLFVQASYQLVSASDLLTVPRVSLRPGQAMDEVLAAFAVPDLHSQGLHETPPANPQFLPVIDSVGSYCGIVSHAEILEAYRSKMLEISHYSED
jgi:CIC family chloride channel protein